MRVRILSFLTSNLARTSHVLKDNKLSRLDKNVFSSFFCCLHCRSFPATGENGNVTEGITRDKILNQPVLEEGTFLLYASKVHEVLF